MVTLGTDAHKRSHTIVAANEQGRQVGQVTVKATSAGHLRALGWASQWPQRRWPVEDCRHLSRRLERDLLGAGEQLVRVPPKLMAGARRQARPRGKSDPIDALAVARAALREPGLPVACLEGVEREVRLLVDHREDLVAERTRAQNRLRWHLHELEPGWEIPAGGLNRAVWLDRVTQRLAIHQGVVAELAGELVGRCRELTVRVNQLERQIAGRVAPLTPRLLGLAGCGALTAAKLVGETAGVGRFRSRAAFAQRDRADPGLVGQPRATSAESGRQPPAEHGLASHRRDPTAPGRGWPGLCPATPRRRCHQDPGHPGAAPTPLRRGLPPPPGRPMPTTPTNLPTTSSLT